MIRALLIVDLCELEGHDQLVVAVGCSQVGQKSHDCWEC